MASHGLSKSRITAWRQCPKRLWLQVNRPELLEESAQVQQLYQTGNEVGEIAQGLCPDGILIEHQNNLSAALAATKAALVAYPERPLFEAAFQHEGLLIRADVLLPTADGYRMTEVKSSTVVKQYHVDDCAVQAWVLKQNNIQVASVELAHIDKTFVYRGDGNYHGLLKSSRLDVETKALLDEVPEWVNGARLTLAGDEPCIEPGAQCDDPYACPFKIHCIKETVVADEPEYPLTVLCNMRGKLKDELRALGYLDARLVPAEYLNDKQLMIQRASKTGKAKFSKRAAKQEMAALSYPRYYIDFETISTKIPRWEGTSPSVSHVPFQWSCHIEYAPGKLHHDMFLDVSGNDPRRGCAELLIKVLAQEGPVLVFSSFEQSRLSELAKIFPDLAPALLSIKARVVDLLPLARKHYYHPAMKGSWSIKAILPTIAPDLRYDQLEVGNGGDAQNAYSEIVHPETTRQRKQQLIDGLSEYCALDTLAMVRLAWFFEGRKVEGINDAAQ